jgi:hypothetical protein
MADAAALFERLVRAFMGDVTYHKHYPCSVQGQDGMTLDLLPDDEAIRGPGGLQGVPIRHGLPGVSVMVKPGARVLLGFEAGDPRKPYASLWESDPGVVLAVMLPGDKRPIARKGDSVLVFINPAVPIAMSGLINGVTPFLGTIQITTPVTGIIQDGNPKVLG